MILVGFFDASAQINFSNEKAIFSPTILGDSSIITQIFLENKANQSIELERIVLTDSNFIINGLNSIVAPLDIQHLTLVFKPKQNIKYVGFLLLFFKDGSTSLLELKGDGIVSNSYYQSTFNLWEKELFDELRKITGQGYVNLGYNVARDRMYGQIDNHQGMVTCVYTGRSALFNTRAGANSNSFNTEHTWPQSFYNQREPERADLHHIFPTDVNANSKRANYPFAWVTNSTWSEGGSKLGNNFFEPRDEHKGVLSRSMLYFIVRYGNAGNFWGNQESIFRQWSDLYSPDSLEIRRNDEIFKYQKNRNPFIDCPEFISRINSFSNPTPRVLFQELNNFTDEVSVSHFALDQKSAPNYVLNVGNTPLTNITWSGLNNWHHQIETDDYFIKILLDSVKDRSKSFIDSLVFNFGNNQSFSHKIHYKHNPTFQIEKKFDSFVVTYQNESQVLQWTPSHNSYTNITVISPEGKLILKESTTSNQLKLNYLRNGIYFVIIQQDGQFFSKKIPVF